MSEGVTVNYMVGKSPVSVGRYTYGFSIGIVKQWDEGAALNIGDFCSIASNVTIFLGGNHRTDWITTFPFGHIFQSELGGEGIVGHPSTRGDIHIGNDVWIGEGATIMSGVRVGDGAVLAANACVVRDVLPFSIVGGNPARLLKMRFDDEVIRLLLKLRWWELPLSEIRKIVPVLCSTPKKAQLHELISLYREGEH